MQTETARTNVAAPPEEVWELVGTFGGLDTWMAGVDSCTVEGDVRTVGTMGMEIVERLVARDADARSITYAIESGAPVTSHQATITVHDADGGSEVTWEVSAEPDEMAAMMRDIYQGALDQVRARFDA